MEIRKRNIFTDEEGPGISFLVRKNNYLMGRYRNGGFAFFNHVFDLDIS